MVSPGAESTVGASAEDGESAAGGGRTGGDTAGRADSDGRPGDPTDRPADGDDRPDPADAPRPPKIDGLPLVGVGPRMMRDPLSFFEDVGFGHDADVVTYEVLGTRGHLLTHPDDVERVLVREHDRFEKGEVFRDTIEAFAPNGLVILEGEEWQRHREAIQPSFTMDRIRTYADVMTGYSVEAADGFVDGETVRIDEAMRDLTLEILAKTLFDLEFGERKRAIAECARQITDRADMESASAYLPLWVPTPANRRAKRARDRFRSVVEDLITERRAEDDAREDLLTLLLDATDGDDAAMTDADLRDELITFLFAGHETTSLALAYAWFCLAHDPDAQARLQAEVDALDGDPTFADLSALPYTGRVVDETLRLYPPAANMLREPTEDVVIGGYRVPARTVVSMPQWVVHRDPRWWDVPEAFRPDRFADDADADRPDYAYFPFGGGPRHCIGMRFARMEATLALATIARRWAVEPVTERPLDLSIRVTLQPTDGIDVRMRERT